MTASIDEVKTAILGANQHGQASMGGVQGAIQELEAMRSLLMQATEGSDQADVTAAISAITRQIQALEDIGRGVYVAMRNAEDVAARL